MASRRLEHRREAERLLGLVQTDAELTYQDKMLMIEMARVHALLAQVGT